MTPFFGITGKLKSLVDRLTATRAGYLDNLSAGAVAQAATAVSNATWTNGRAALLDGIIQTSIIQSIQTGWQPYTGGTAGTGEDIIYTDITISAVTVAKCFVIVQGNVIDPSSVGWPATGRLTSTTNLRIGSSRANANGIAGARWYVVEFK